MSAASGLTRNLHVCKLVSLLASGLSSPSLSGAAHFIYCSVTLNRAGECRRCDPHKIEDDKNIKTEDQPISLVPFCHSVAPLWRKHGSQLPCGAQGQHPVLVSCALM